MSEEQGIKVDTPRFYQENEISETDGHELLSIGLHPVEGSHEKSVLRFVILPRDAARYGYRYKSEEFLCLVSRSDLTRALQRIVPSLNGSSEMKKILDTLLRIEEKLPENCESNTTS